MRPERAYFGQKDAQQAAVIRQLVRDLEPAARDPRPADGARGRRARALVAQRPALAARSATARSRCRVRSSPARRRTPQARDPVAAARAALNGLTPDYVELFDLDGTLVLASAVRVGSIRLIDNVLLKGDLE